MSKKQFNICSCLNLNKGKKEACIELAKIQWTNEFQKNTNFQITHKDIQSGADVKYNHKILSNEGCVVISESLQVSKSANYTLNIEGEHLLLSFLFRGEAYEEEQCIVFNRKGFGSIHIFYNNKNNNEYQFSLDEGKSHFVHILLSRSYYQYLFEHEFFSQQFSLYNHVISQLPFTTTAGLYNLNIIVKNTVRKIVEKQFDAHMRSLFIHAQLKTLFNELHEQEYNKQLAIQQQPFEEHKEIYEARDILHAQIANPPTIKELAKIILINELRLKQDFKKIFGSTIHAYTVQVRMESAMYLIKQGQLSIAEIGQQLGYKDPSHFISVFKKYYGTTPKNI